VTGHGLPAEKVALNDGFEDFGRTRMVPDAFGIDDRDGPAHANPEAVGLGAEDERLRTDESEFLQAALQEFPGRDPGVPGAALRFGRIGTEEDVALEAAQTQGVHRGGQFGRGHKRLAGCFHEANG
jgi:hypothetical protein